MSTIQGRIVHTTPDVTPQACPPFRIIPYCLHGNIQASIEEKGEGEGVEKKKKNQMPPPPPSSNPLRYKQTNKQIKKKATLIK